MQNLYALAFGGLLLLGARMGDLLGRRQVFIGGIALLTISFPEGSERTRAIALYSA